MTDPPRIWKQGERCLLTSAGMTVEATVLLASENGRSLVLEFEAILGGYVAGMPVLWYPDGAAFYDTFCWQEVKLEPRRPDDEAKESSPG